MAETTESGQAAQPAAAPAAQSAPTIAQGQTTSVAEGGTQALEEQPTEPAQGATAERQSSLWDNWLLYAVIGLWVWYLFGNKKRRLAKANEKKEQERRNNLQKGDKIVTIGRMHGEVVAFTDDSVTLKPDNKSDYTMTFERGAILRVLPRPGEEEEAAADAKK